MPSPLSQLWTLFNDELPDPQRRLFRHHCPPDKDLSYDPTYAWPRFAIWLLMDPEYGLINRYGEVRSEKYESIQAPDESAQALCRSIAALFQAHIDGGNLDGALIRQLTDQVSVLDDGQRGATLQFLMMPSPDDAGFSAADAYAQAKSWDAARATDGDVSAYQAAFTQGRQLHLIRQSEKFLELLNA